jgi:hypothetical protein
VNTVMNFGFHKMLGKLLSICTTGGFSRKAQVHEARSLVWPIRLKDFLRLCNKYRRESR